MKKRNSIEIFKRRVRDSDISGIPCFIEFDYLRIGCSCGYRGMEELIFCDKLARHTHRFEEHVVMLCKFMTMNLPTAAELRGISINKTSQELGL